MPSANFKAYALKATTKPILPVLALKFEVKITCIITFAKSPVVETGEIVFAVLMKSFKFSKALMEEHFNENYVESDKYPRSTFEGQIINLDEIQFDKAGTYEATIQGKLTIHGETKEIEEKGTITVANEGIVGNSKFKIDLYDYKIDIPKVVKENIAESIEITVEMDYKPYGN